LDGLTIARERIAREAEEKTGFLDLGRLGLTKLPDELFRLEHLRRLNLGRWYVDEDGERHTSASDLNDNAAAAQVHLLAGLGELRHLFLDATDLERFQDWRNRWGDSSRGYFVIPFCR